MQAEDWKQKYEDLALEQRRSRRVRVLALTGVAALAGTVGYVTGFLRVGR